MNEKLEEILRSFLYWNKAKRYYRRIYREELKSNPFSRYSLPERMMDSCEGKARAYYDSYKILTSS